MNINSLILKDGKKIEPSSKINLIIGANNTGKSTFIKELSTSIRQKYINNNQSKWFFKIKLTQEFPKNRILSLFKKINEVEALSEIPPELFNERSGYSPGGRNKLNINGYEADNLNNYVNDNQEKEINIIVGTSQKHSIGSGTGEDVFLRIITNAEICDEFCDSRLSGSFGTVINNLLSDDNTDSSIARHLFTDKTLLAKIQKNILEVFGEKIGFDNLQQGEKNIRIINEADARKKYTPEWWRDNCPRLSDQGDGIRAYAKIITTLFDEEYSVIFIDEPEAFLHPPQRKALGKFMAELSKVSNKQLFVATHDAEFIRGILLGVRKDFDEIAVFRTIANGSSRKIEEFALASLSSLIRQTRTIQPRKATIYNELFLNSLFFKKTILTESESDKIIYEYFASVYFHDLFTDVNFIGLNGKTTIKDVFDEMRKMSINVSCVVDFDFLFNTDSIPSCINNTLRQKHSTFAKKIKDNYNKNIKDCSIKKQGVIFFKNSNDLREECDKLINEYASNGIHIVPVGEIESWFDVGHGNIHKIIEKIEGIKQYKKLGNFIKNIIK